MSVFIIGYMFAGKTTYGQQLAGELHLPFIDLDVQIEQHCHKTIPGIFAEKGEAFFRQTEHEVLEEICMNKTHAVIACGGGTPCHHDNLALMKKHGRVIYLRTPVETITERAMKERQNRPLLSHISDNELGAFITNQLREREFFYLQADLIRDSQSIIETKNNP